MSDISACSYHVPVASGVNQLQFFLQIFPNKGKAWECSYCFIHFNLLWLVFQAVTQPCLMLSALVWIFIFNIGLFWCIKKGVDVLKRFFFLLWMLSLLAALLTLLSNFVSRSLPPLLSSPLRPYSPTPPLVHPSLASCHPLPDQIAGLLHDGLQYLALTAVWW